MTTCFGYTRVSTVKQGEGVSLEAQKDEIIRYAEKHDLKISRWFEEKETAAKSGRPIFNAIVKDLMNHKADGLIVHKIDRSARNFRDWAQIGELADKGIAIHFATESLDFQSRGGRLTADIQAVIASDYIRNLREEAIKGLKGRLKQGLYPFRAPIGYLDQGGGKPKILDPAKAPLIREMYDLYALGNHGIRSLQTEMARQGLRNLRGGLVSRHGIETILSNPFYCGLIRIARTGETYEGVHEPIIPVGLFHRVQAMKAGKCGKKTTRHMHVYRGLFKCQFCTMAMIAERQKGHVYYRCHTPDCPTTGIREEALEQAVRSELKRHALHPSHLDILKRAIDEWYQDQKSRAGDKSVLRLQLGRLETRLDALTDAVIDRLIDKEVYHRKREAILFETQGIRDKLGENRDFGAQRASLGKFLELVKNLAWLYEIAESAEKRLITQYATSNRTIAGKSICLEPSNWLQAVQSTSGDPDGAPYRPTSRTRRQMQLQQIDALLALLVPANGPELLGEVVEIFDRHIGVPSAAAPKKWLNPVWVEPGARNGIG